MIKKEYDLDISSPVAICDDEICNSIKDSSGNWNYEDSDIVTLGIFYGNKITIYQREKSDTLSSWKQALLKELEKMPVMFSLNTKMEKYGLKGFLNLNLFFEEIQPFRGRGTNKDNLFKILVDNGVVPKESEPIDPFNGDSSLVLSSYAKEDYESIINHNKNCLIKEYFIFINRFWFLKRYSKYIDRKGWWIPKTPLGVEPIVFREEEDEDDSSGYKYY
jgi:hypothetical protein